MRRCCAFPFALAGLFLFFFCFRVRSLYEIDGQFTHDVDAIQLNSTVELTHVIGINRTDNATQLSATVEDSC